MATNDSLQDQNHDLAQGELPSQPIELLKEEKQQPQSPRLSTSSQSPPPPQPSQQRSQDEEQKQETSDNNASQEDEDLEEGELKDDEDDDDDDEVESQPPLAGADLGTKRPFGYNNNNNDDNNNSGTAKELSYNDNRNDAHLHQQSYLPHYSATNNGPGPHYPGRRMSPNSPQLADLQGGGPYAPNNHHHFNSLPNNNHYRYPAGEGLGPQPPMNLHNQMGGSGPIYARGGPGGVGPMQKVNIRCRFYSKAGNKCTWGDHCRFEHRDESPGPEFDGRPPPGMVAGRGPAMPMGSADRAQYPPYSGRHQPYPPPPPGHGGYPYEAYGHHHSTPPPMAPYWRTQHSPYPSASSGQPPESVSPSLLPTPESGVTAAGGPSNRGLPSQQQPPGVSSVGGSSSGSIPPNLAGANSPSYPSPSSSFGVYERKHRLAYESAPWNDRNHPPPSKYDRGEIAGYPPSGRGFYRNHYSREPPYGRDPLPPMCGQYPGYPAYPSAYRGGQMGPHTSHYKSMSSSQRLVPPDGRGPRSMKRGHDEDESSWSDSGSEDSILGQASYSNKRHATKNTKNQDQDQPENPLSEEPLDQGSGTPPGEPLPEDRERQEMLLNKLKEIEDLMAKKKSKQEDPT